MTDFSTVLKKLLGRQNLPAEEAGYAMDEIMEGRVNAAQIAAFLTAMKLKGETVEELVGCVRTMRKKAVQVKHSKNRLLDTAGTGGDGCSTFNISTCAAIVAAGAGVAVAKHGNRAVSGASGSIDVLEELSVSIPANCEEAERQLGETGITFLFAPVFHPAMKQVAPVRKELGFKTIFNLLGPLANPANAKRQLIGAYSSDAAEKIAKAAQALGTERTVVVSSDTDEVSISSETTIYETDGNTMQRNVIRPEDFGLERARQSAIMARDKAESARIVLGVLHGMAGPVRDIVLLNAAAALYAAGTAQNIKEGLEKAKESIDSGKALEKLERLRGIDILDRFIAQAKENIKAGYYDITNQVFQTVKKVSLRQTLLAKKFSLIAEIKHASPAGEYSFDGIDAAKAAATFKSAGADAISVVIEPKIFKGNMMDIQVAKQAGLPVLCKDFIFDESQIQAAAASGADCVLLVMKVTDRVGQNINGLIDAAHSLGLEVLLECYDGEEMKRAYATNADILGVNNRNLQTLKVDIQRTKDVLRAAGPDSKNRPVISESGIKTRADAEYAKASGANGILVGTALWKAGNQAERIRELQVR